MASEDAVKSRILSHLNSSHADSLSAYLQHFNRVSPRAASNAAILDISLSSMSIRDSANRMHTVRFSPPMASWADARARTVAMDLAARRALGVRIAAYEPPSRPHHVVVAALCLLTFVLYLTYQHIVPGTFVHDVLLPYFPGGAEWFLWIVRVQVIPVALIHSTEAFLLDQTRLSRYGVQRFSGVWLKWMLSCFIEGFGCFQRIDAEARRQEAVWDKEREQEKENAGKTGSH